MAEPNVSSGRPAADGNDPKATAGGGTVIASASSAPQPPPMGGRTMVAGAPPPLAKPPGGGAAGRTVVASAASAPAAPAAEAPELSGGTVVASNDSPAAGVPAAVVHAHSMPMPIDLVGQTLLGRYTILKKLGEGGMGTVYLCEHATIGKKFAVKVLSHELAHKEDLRERFLQEARAASMISQENVVEISDFGDTPDGSVFFVMEFLQGEDLSDTVKAQGRLPWARVKAIMLQVCRALGAAHDAGIIHRDMKPENCYRIKRGNNEDFIKVLDFGIAKVTSEDEGEGKGLTRTGMIFGTPEYMSPEQAQGAKPDHRVDIYAAGVIMYELLTGRVPFTADTFMGILTKHMFEVPEAPSSVVPDADIPPEVEAIILKAMQKDRDLRFSSMAEMGEAIEAVGTGAAAVNVVTENIARPSTGEMAFHGARTATPMPGTIPPLAADYQDPSKSKKGLFFSIIGGLALIAGGVGAYLAFFNDKEEIGQAQEQPQGDPAVVEQPEEPEPEVDPQVVEEPDKVKEIAAGTETVNYRITTRGPDNNPIVAKIQDPLDKAIYGMTNTEDGVEVEKSEEPLKLLLVAEGFETKEIEIIPVRDKFFEYELTPEKKPAPTKTTPKKPEPKKPEPKKPEPKKPEPKKPDEKSKTDSKEDKPRRVSPDLKDPFGARK